MKEWTKESLHKHFSSFPFETEALEHLHGNKGHRKRAKKYAEDNPELVGYITFPMSDRSYENGMLFYRIEGGKAEGASAWQMYLEVYHKILNYRDY